MRFFVAPKPDSLIFMARVGAEAQGICTVPATEGWLPFGKARKLSACYKGFDSQCFQRVSVFTVAGSRHGHDADK